MRIALGVEYDGGGFCGWQTQRARCSVQDALENALAGIAAEPVSMVRTVCAGRTDAGVHALAQVVHFDTTADRPESAWVRGVNALTPPALAVTWVRPVAAEFSARYSAKSRAYRYVLLNHPVRPAAESGRVGWYHTPLHMESMRVAAANLVGEHDFGAFRSAECQAKSPVRTLMQLEIMQQGAYIVFDFRANGFLHHMVRNIVGSLVYVGNGKYGPQWISKLLDSRDRRLAAPTFDAAGLYLTGVEYDPVWGLPHAPRAALPPFSTLASVEA